MARTSVPSNDNLIMSKQVESHFAHVRRVYFPRWNEKGEWSVSFDHAGTRGKTGYCDSKTKTIFLSYEVFGMTLAGMRALLIHEICHDVSAAGHNSRWARRMESAARRAEIVGEKDVARVLRMDIYSYCDGTVFKTVTGLEFAELLGADEEYVEDEPL